MSPSPVVNFHASAHSTILANAKPPFPPSLPVVVQMDTGFCVWSFQGSILYRNPILMDKFCQLLWRPRPPSLLTEEDLQVGSI